MQKPRRALQVRPLKVNQNVYHGATEALSFTRTKIQAGYQSHQAAERVRSIPVPPRSTASATRTTRDMGRTTKYPNSSNAEKEGEEDGVCCLTRRISTRHKIPDTSRNRQESMCQSMRAH